MAPVAGVHETLSSPLSSRHVFGIPVHVKGLIRARHCSVMPIVPSNIFPGGCQMIFRKQVGPGGAFVYEDGNPTGCTAS